MYIDVGNQAKNKAVFDWLFDQKDAIEAEFGEPLDWRRMDDKQASKIVKTYNSKGSLREQDKWAKLQDLLIQAMIRFDKTLRSQIRELKV